MFMKHNMLSLGLAPEGRQNREQTQCIHIAAALPFWAFLDSALLERKGGHGGVVHNGPGVEAAGGLGVEGILALASSLGKGLASSTIHPTHPFFHVGSS